MIYLNNAATSYPKPDCVKESVNKAIEQIPTAQFRSTQKENNNRATTCKKQLGKLLGILDYERIFFTSGATDSLNQVLHGITATCHHMITTATEHNSVLRPLHNFVDYGTFSYSLLPCDVNGVLCYDKLESLLTRNTDVILVNHCSNVTGAVVDLKRINTFAKRHNLLLVVDASQSAGCIPIDVDQLGIDVLIFTGHKSLLGIQGIGGYYLSRALVLPPQRFGGTGSDSFLLKYSRDNYEYEVGTQNGVGIAALHSAVSYILQEGVESIHQKELSLIHTLYDGLSVCQLVTLYGTKETIQGPVLSFNIKGLSPSDVAYILHTSYDIIVRTGLHCAPLIHEVLGTLPMGTVRISPSYFTTTGEIDIFLSSIQELCNSLIV